MDSSVVMRPPSVGDRIKYSKLPQSVVKALSKKGIATFKGLVGRDPQKLFDHLRLSDVTSHELARLNEALALRGIGPITPWKHLEAGPGKLPYTVLDRLWKEGVSTLGKLERLGPTKLPEVVGRRNAPRVLRYLKAEGIDAERLLAWYVLEGLPEKTVSMFEKWKIRTIDDLFEKSGAGDLHRTIEYCRWWFRRKYPHLCSTAKPS